MAPRSDRSGAETKAEVRRVALQLFSAQGYEATSLRQIAEALGISKAALYYHFTSKEEIVREGFAGRGREAAELLAWVRTQQAGPQLVEAAVLRWVDTLSVEKLQGIRFMNANPNLVPTEAATEAGSEEIGSALETVAVLAAGEGANAQRRLLVRMAFLSINAAVMAAAGTDISDADIVTTARASARALLAALD